MERAVAYLINENATYHRMLLRSVRMVREHNPRIPIHVFLIGDGDRLTIPRENLFPPTAGHRRYPGAFVERCARLGCVVTAREPYAESGDGDFFHVNRCHLGDVESDSLLYLDADTFVFGDIARLFDDYRECDLAAAEASWVYGRGWKEGYLPRAPVSSGVILFNAGHHRGWSRSLPGLIAGIRRREYPVSEFVYSLHGDALLREEFATNLWIGDRAVSYFRKEDVHLVLHDHEIGEVGRSLVFHSYTPNWSRARRQVDGQARRIGRRLIL